MNYALRRVVEQITRSWTYQRRLPSTFGRAPIVVTPSNSLSGYGNSQTGGVLEEQVIPTFNLDFLLERLPRPNVVKCDVEGAEIEVFEGQMNMLRQVRPTVVCEVGEKASPVITRLFRESGYVLFDGDKPLAGAQDAQAACWNTIAVPDERRAEVA